MSVANVARRALRKKLSKCTFKQKKLFNFMYGSIDEIPLSKLEWAEQQIDRALIKNEQDEKDATW